MSNLANANKFLRAKMYDEALAGFEIAWQDCIEKTYPSAIAEYCANQLHILNKRRLQALQHPCCLITASDSKYFQPLLMLLDSLFSSDSDIDINIFVFDLGLKESQINILTGLDKVKVFTWSEKKLKEYASCCNFDILNPATYFFKVYAFHEGVKLAQESLGADKLNVLWSDSGNYFQHSPLEIFYNIEAHNYFFIDHSDVGIYYNNPVNNLASVLAPAMFEGNLDIPFLSEEQMLLPYIKANLFGIHICQETQLFREQHLEICSKTTALCDPRKIENSELSKHWNRHYGNPSELLRYRYGRHEQSVWSYLVALHELDILNTSNYSFTVAAGSNTLSPKDYSNTIIPKITKNFPCFKSYITSFVKEYGEEAHCPNTLSKKDLISKYDLVSQRIFLQEKRFCGLGFPHPIQSMRSIVKLHRGSMARRDEYKYLGRLLNHADNIRDDIFVLLGNGPSLADVDLNALADHHTFGLNAAYRAYNKINFWPTYFGCFDALVCAHHSSSFKELITNSPISKFFFIDKDDDGNKIFTENHIIKSPKFQNIDFRYRTPIEKARTDILSLSFDNFIDSRTSGSNSIQAGLLMGYRKFILLGVDQNYVEVVEGAKKDNNYHKLIMERTPDHNPNYWFSDYQQAGDKFNRPNLTGSQIPAWNNLSMTLHDLGIKCMVYNCSPITRLESFRKAELQAAISDLQKTNVHQLDKYTSPRLFSKFV